MGGTRPSLKMDHEALLRVAEKQAAGPGNGHKTLNQGSAPGGARITRIDPLQGLPELSKLSCVSCHANQDKHQKLFGTSCLSCHGAESWKIPQYRHPSPNNRDCVQCHQAPPSHYMMHFEMVSKKVAGVEHADVKQCYLCHRTTSWNDIQGKGWYKHH
jgi:hypothetical protein